MRAGDDDSMILTTQSLTLPERWSETE